MLKMLAQSLLNEQLINKDDRIVVGVSGGPDSIALLHLLVELNRSHDWNLDLHIAHLNHQVRGEDSLQDAVFVQATADQLSIPCTIETRDIPTLSKTHSKGLEETGRQERYAFFGRVCLRTNSKLIAVGHHADDNAETILHRIFRGTGLRGLGGIPPTRPLTPGSDVRIVRPLLKFTRQSILNYLSDAGVDYREDHTNDFNEPMRNRIRNNIIPLIEADVNTQVREALTRLGEQAQWLQEFLGETVQRTFNTLIISHTDQEIILNADALSRKSRIVQTELIRLAYRSFGLGEQDLAFSHLVSVLDIIADPASGKQVNLPGGMTIEKRYHQLIFSLPSDEPRETIAPVIAIHLPGLTLLPIRRLEIECTIKDVALTEIPKLRHTGSPMEEYVDYNALRPPLVVRSRRAGERFYPLGAPGSKKLADFLTDSKVDPKEREKVAVLCDHLGPIWVIGHRIDDRVKLTGLTRKVLHLRAKSLES